MRANRGPEFADEGEHLAVSTPRAARGVRIDVNFKRITFSLDKVLGVAHVRRGFYSPISRMERAASNDIRPGPVEQHHAWRRRRARGQTVRRDLTSVRSQRRARASWGQCVV